ncbi:hypothetical protein, conserved [Angomonas deanei]|uniref:Uncharacterized protein n=1 Tax=Angomonas deanei TaxID=59799 RepID=A0A7G2C204_9TRYP|nr:hypothetical protein, conserved [Angomonas deanei]
MGNKASSSSTRTVSPAVKSFLDPLERLSHVERIRHLLDVGKKCVTEPPYTAPATDVPAVELLQMLSSSGVHYHRLMATFALRGAAEKLVHTNDNAVMVSMKDICYTLLNDSCKDIQVNCLRPAVYLSTADELQKILSELPVCLLDDFCHVLLKKRPAEAQPLLDAFLPRTTASRRRWVLAKYASETVLEATPAVKEGVLYWPPLALHQLTVAQPNWVTSHFTALAAQTPADALHPLPLRTALRTVMLALGDGDRKEQLQKGLALVQAELPRSATCKKEINEVLRVYVKKAPVALDAVEYVVANKAVYHGLVSLSFSRAGWKVLVTRLDLVAELVKMDALPELFDWGFFHLPKEVRRFLYQNYRPKMLNSADNMIPINLIEHLPDEADRHTEARHAWAQPALKTDPYEHMGCLSLLPFDEAKEKEKNTLPTPNQNTDSAWRTCYPALLVCSRPSTATCSTVCSAKTSKTPFRKR